MNTIYFRTTPTIYSNLAPLIDEADRNQPPPHISYINTGHCEHILPEEPTLGNDGMAYVAVPDFLLGVNGAEQWMNYPGVEMIDEETFRRGMEQSGS